jgi:PTH2 family peptidyl-tRNA hydrolase
VIKQTILIRNDLNMRKGKMVAQGAHAALSAALTVLDTPECKEWLETGMTKIVLYVRSEQELLDFYRLAVAHGFPAALIKDKAHTEFKEPTHTAVAIGPADKDRIDILTKDLPLL